MSPMLVPVACWRDAAGMLRAAAPDVASSELQAASEQRLLPMVRLAIESALTQRLLDGTPLPDTRDGSPPVDYPPRPGLRWLTVHINVAHLRALAVHQRGCP